MLEVLAQSAMAKGSPAADGKYLHVPVGPRLANVLSLAYRARRAVLLEGPTGIGKSEVVRQVAKSLGVATAVLDLSLLEPPDLVGLPVIEGGRTTYAAPRALPQGGEGILMLEELNRAERYIQQPALQLLTARRLHEYELPPGWVCFAAINPETGDYQVTPLDRALRARFLQVSVRADRAAWLGWAQLNGVHPAVVALAQAHERFLDDVPPRSWSYTSDLLHTITPAERKDEVLLRDALGGYLPPAWVELLVASRESWSGGLELDVRAVLSSYGPKSALAADIAAYKAKGQTDRLDEIAQRLAPLLSGPEAGVLAAQGLLSLSSFEALLGDLPGDQREKLGEAIARNPTATTLLDVAPAELLTNYAGSPAEKKLLAWRADPLRSYRVGLAVTGLRAHLERQAKVADLRKSNAVRTCLGQLLTQLPERTALPLVDTLKKLGVTPVRPQ